MNTTTISNHSIMMSSVQQRTPTKRTKPKRKNHNNKPIKVVYISNPMKVKTSASEFRALVQELTGQDAESPPDPSRFQDSGGDDGGGGGLHVGSKVGGGDENDHTLVVVPPPQVCDPNNQVQPSGGSSSFESFEPFDDVFTPLMVENISSLLPASVFYESPQVDNDNW